MTNLGAGDIETWEGQSRDRRHPNSEDGLVPDPLVAVRIDCLLEENRGAASRAPYSGSSAGEDQGLTIARRKPVVLTVVLDHARVSYFEKFQSRVLARRDFHGLGREVIAVVLDVG